MDNAGAQEAGLLLLQDMGLWEGIYLLPALALDDLHQLIEIVSVEVRDLTEGVFVDGEGVACADRNRYLPQQVW